VVVVVVAYCAFWEEWNKGHQGVEQRKPAALDGAAAVWDCRRVA
jgi:hypothetical protein